MIIGRYMYVARLLLIAVVTMVVCVAVMLPLVDVSAPYLLVDGVIAGILLALLWQALKSAAAYSIHLTFSPAQKYINYSALALLFVVCWVGVGMLLLLLLLPYNDFLLFLPTCPTRVLLALLVYGLIILFYDYLQLKGEQDEGELLVENDSEKEYLTASATQDQHYDDIIEHVAVKSGQQIDLVFVSEIICIQAEGDYVMIHSTNGGFLKEQTMKYFVDHLPKSKFVRVHRSYIVNIDFIRRIETYEKQQQLIILHNNLQAKVSITGYRELKNRLNL